MASTVFTITLFAAASFDSLALTVTKAESLWFCSEVFHLSGYCDATKN